MVWTHLLYILLAIVLFYIVNWIGERAKPMDFGYVQISITIQEETAPLFNYFFKVLAPVVYIICLAALFQVLKLDCLNERIYLVVVYYWIYRFLFTILRGRIRLLNWGLQILYWTSSIALAYWVNTVIDSVNSILPDPKTLLEELWILIILFLYSVFNKIDYSREGAKRRIKRYTYDKYDSFVNRFGSIIDGSIKSDWLKAATYAIMVYEDYNRPKAARLLERILFRRSKNNHSYGIMQVKSHSPLSDEESIVRAIGIIKQVVRKYIEDDCFEDMDSFYLLGLIEEIFKLYNPGDPSYSSEVKFVYNNITERYYPNLPERVSLQDARSEV